MELDPLIVKQGLLALWGLWLALVVLLNLLNVLFSLGKLPAGWLFHSHNFASLLEATRIYHTPRWVVWLMFAGVIFLEAVAAVLLLAAAVQFTPGAATLAFAVALLLWGGFILANEFFLTFLTETQGAYSLAATHRSIFVALLVSLIAIHALP